MLKTISEVGETGWKDLVDRLGMGGAILFILEYEKGYGNYTEERKKISGKKRLDEILKEVKRK
jgi:hypothetical protein